MRVLATRLFGAPALLDTAAFERACAAEREAELRARMKEDNPELAQGIESCANVAELLAFADTRDLACTRQAQKLFVEGGRLARIDQVGVSSGQLTLEWAARGMGFGQVQIYVGEDGKLHADTECSGRHFLRAVLLRLADEIVIDD